MAKTVALADLDAAKSVKPDTSAADALKAKLAELEGAHAATKDKAASAESEAAATAKQLAKANQSLASAAEDLEILQKEFDTYKLEADAKAKTHEADYKEMNSTMTQLVEEEHKKAEAALAKIKELEKKAADADAGVKELEAKIKVKEAELAEAKVCAV